MNGNSNMPLTLVVSISLILQMLFTHGSDSLYRPWKSLSHGDVDPPVEQN